MSDPNPFADLLDTPRMYPWRLDPVNRRVMFVEMSAEAYRASRFLDHRIAGSSGPAYDVGLDKLVARFERAGDGIHPRPINWIYHIGYTGSTLVSRCVEALADALVLREPEPLRVLAAVRAGTVPGADGFPVSQVLPILAWLWSRTWRSDQPVVVKATSSCNNLIADLLSLCDGSRAVFVYTSLRDFLLSTVRCPARVGEARAKLADIAGLLDRLYADAATRACEDNAPPSPDHLDDFQAVATVWWAFMRLGTTGGGGNEPDERVHPLAFDTFLADPGAALAGIARHLGLSADAAAVDAVVNGPVLAEHAKSASGAAFDRDRRQRTLEAVYREHRAATEAALAWARDRLPPVAGAVSPAV